MPAELAAITTRAGIKRDGTALDGNYYNDGQWVRFRLGRPKKIGGYREIVNGLLGPIRGMFSVSRHPEHILFCLSNAGVQCQIVDAEGAASGTFERTPASFVSRNYTWTHDTLYDQTGTPSVKVIVHPSGSSWNDIDSTTENPIYIGEATASDALTAIPDITVSGGIVVLQPYLFAYGSNGIIRNSAANNPTNFTLGDANTANVSGTKIVRGAPLKGGGNAPSGLFWSLDSLIRVSYVGGTAKWRYDNLAQSTILCTNGVIEYEGVYYWPGIDRFYIYNGVVKELPNMMNQDFFFDNLNWEHRQKIWATVVPRWGEIWWHFPRGTSTECNHAIIYNVRENSWYDTAINRSAGVAPRVLYFPVWADSVDNDYVTTDRYRIYRHETGLDAVFGEQQVALAAHFETSSFGIATGGPDGSLAVTPNVQTRVTRIEPDFSMSGQLSVSIEGASHAHGSETQSERQTFNSDTPFVDFALQHRVVRLRIDSNNTGSDFHMGRTVVHVEPGDPRQ